MTNTENNTEAMNTSAAGEGTGRIALALAKAQGEFKPLKKSRTAKVPMKAGGYYTYQYADLGDVVECSREALSKHELCFIQTEQSAGMKGGILTTIFHSSGQQLRSWTSLVGGTQGTGPQAHGSALTYTRRYGLCLALGIVAEEDDDAQVAEGAGGGEEGEERSAPNREGRGGSDGSGGGRPIAARGHREAAQPPIRNRARRQMDARRRPRVHG
jgi:hypothetical protein